MKFLSRGGEWVDDPNDAYKVSEEDAKSYRDRLSATSEDRATHEFNIKVFEDTE